MPRRRLRTPCSSFIARPREGNLKSDEVRDLARDRGERKNKTPAVQAAVKAKGLTRSLQRLDLGVVGEDEKVGLFKELGELGKTIEEILG